MLIKCSQRHVWGLQQVHGKMYIIKNKTKQKRGMGGGECSTVASQANPPPEVLASHNGSDSSPSCTTSSLAPWKAEKDSSSRQAPATTYVTEKTFLASRLA